MTTPHRPSVRSSINSGPSSFLKHLLDEINGTGPPTASCNSKPPRVSPRVRSSRDKERRVPSVWVSGDVVAQETRERLRTADEARLKNTDTFSEEQDGLGGKALLRTRPNLSKLKTQLPAPSQDEVAQSSSTLTCSESGLSSTTSNSEAPSSALTTSSTSAMLAPSHFGSGNNSPRKREQGLDDIECQHVSKKMRSIPSPDVQDLLIPTNGEPHLTMDFRDLLDRGNLLCEKASPERTVARSFVYMSNEHRCLESLPSGYSFAIDDPASAKAPRPTTQREPGWQRTSTTPDLAETPETPSYARPFHLFDTSVFMHEDGRGNKCMQDISIYKATHGDEWAENSLCEHCFRQRGLFSRVLAYGYESCGREERLNDYYWEPAVGLKF